MLSRSEGEFSGKLGNWSSKNFWGGIVERNYKFRKRLEIVHQPNLRTENVVLAKDEVLIEDGWTILISADCEKLVENVAKDLQDYLFTSMNVSVLIKRTEELANAALQGESVIILATKDELPQLGGELSVPRSYRYICSQQQIIICGNDARGVGQGSYYLEDLMNLRELSALTFVDTVRKPLFSPRMVHSGFGLDEYPDSYLNAIAHAGMDAILVFAKGVDETPYGYLDFNHLIYRAKNYGLDVYLYSYLKSEMHPEDSGAQEYYDGTYGALFEACPEAKGVILVGESCEFPSRDPNTTGKMRYDAPQDGLPSTKPSPGWWPCYDYPQFLNLLKKTIHKHSPDAEIVFWTYNWGWAPQEARLELIRNLPEGITLQVTFEMFEQIQHSGVTNYCADYTISFPGPGKYFASEAEEAKKRNIKLYTMSNTAGMTWDFGVVPYIPVPFQWMKRHKALKDAQEALGLSGLMESHHYGWWPSVVSELAKWNYWSPSPEPEKILERMAKRDFGEGASAALEAWCSWSEAITHYITTEEDQYGPFRVGPSYPLLFWQEPFVPSVNLPASEHAHFGNRIVLPNYFFHEHVLQSPGASRLPVEIKSLHEFIDLWKRGIEALENALDEVPQKKRVDAQLMLGLGKFILNSAKTAIHVKEWWRRRWQLQVEANPTEASKILDEMESIAKSEIENAKATIPLVEADSRLGWEPSMEYMTDKEHLLWKIEQVTRVIEEEIPKFRQTLALTRGE